MKKRITALLMLAVMLLCSCSQGGAVTDAPATEPATDAITDAPAREIVISDTEKCYYRTIIQTGSATTISDAATSLKISCYDLTGNQLWISRDGSEKPAENEILVGPTNRPESAQIAEGLKENEYRICFVGTKLVVAGGSRGATVAAVDRLIADYFKSGSTEIKIPENIDIKGEIDMKLATDLDSGWNDLVFEASNNVDLKYQIWMPKNYSADKDYPCILYMHSAGVRCDDNSHINTAEAKFLRNFESSKYAKECIVIAPCCPNTHKWVTVNTWAEGKYDFVNTKMADYMTATLELFADYREKLAIDDNRLYTYGMSMGGFAVWDLLARNPGVFAAAIPVAAAGDPTTVSTMGKTAIWIFHGTADEAVPYQSAVNMHDALTAIGRTDVKFTTFEGAGHGIWSKTADTEGLFDWLFSQKLN
ncbi:MAG: prolyl oligopeptidase family serine peptidase [Clostridia bacterium]|nr:prolyl oligopeptidase family serine peptidase [Clostridia bacterium]